MSLRGVACQIREFRIDQVPVPLRVGVETGHPQGSHRRVNFLGAQNAALARRHHLHDVGPQATCCLRQLHTSFWRTLPRP